MVIESSKFMNVLGEDYWVDFGTLLGLHRENGVIAHDIDVDYAMLVKSYEKVLKMKHLVPNGFSFHDTSYRHLAETIYELQGI